MSEKLWKYELHPSVVEFLLFAVDKVQVSGVQGAQSIINATNVLRNPINLDELKPEEVKDETPEDPKEKKPEDKKEEKPDKK